MENTQDTSFKSPIPADAPDLDLYTIPGHSNWFSWDYIHEIEKLSLREFFEGSSITRTPKTYKEYRDFIISKYREDPSRRLTFTEVRKSLVGDISLLQKVFSFLELWGLINFEAPSPVEDLTEEDEWKVRAEEGAPHGVRVVAAPNSLKPVTVPPLPLSRGYNGDLVDGGFKLPPLASFSDVYSELLQQKGPVCANCKECCDSGLYEYTKEESFVICVNCFKNENYGDNKSLNDFKFTVWIPDSGSPGAVWTEAETLLLLESVLKHGDDWELVAQNVQTKSKLECISKLIQLPFGELMLGSAHRKGKFWNINGDINSVKHMQLASTDSQGTTKTENQCHEIKNESQQNGKADNQGPPLKKVCTAPISDASSFLMKQAARISTLVGPHITASAAEAAVSAVCYENLCTREIFDGDDDGDHDIGSSPHHNEKERAPQVEYSEGRPTQSETQDTSPEKNAIPLTLRMRAATATALGAAAARAKLLADQEEKEMEHLVATIIETQLEKLQRKIRHFEDLELMMEKECAQMEELEDSLIAERINVLQRVFSAGISPWREQTSVKSQAGSVL